MPESRGRGNNNVINPYTNTIQTLEHGALTVLLFKGDDIKIEK